MAVIAEVHHDAAGLAWPVNVAPAEVTVLLLSPKDEAVVAAAETIYAELQAAGVGTLIDDRDERPGVKFRDAELVGIPLRISVGSRDLADGLVEITDRGTGEKERVPAGQAVTHVLRYLSSRRASEAGDAP
jgi:prolyl-tRNA synthetase